MKRVGATIGSKYEIVRLIGSGGMGEVYEARHRDLGRRVAVKLLLPKHAEDPELVRRFVTEARAAGALEHENIAAVFDTGDTVDGARYLVMEFLEGEDGASLLQREGHVSLARALRLGIQVCRGLAAVHALGIVHRDLKPGNLFLTKRADGAELVKLLDFGIAKLVAPDGSSAATESGLGTPHYLSPEQAQGGLLDFRTDLYALGVILYELVSGRKPHDGGSTFEIAHRIATRPPAKLATVRHGLPPAFVDCVETAMAREPADRFPSAKAMQQRLSDALAELERSAGETPASHRATAETQPSLETRARHVETRTEPTTTHVPVAPPAPAERRDGQPGARAALRLAVLALAAAGVWTAARYTSRRVGSVDDTAPARTPATASPAPARAPSAATAEKPAREASEHPPERPDTPLPTPVPAPAARGPAMRGNRRPLERVATSAGLPQAAAAVALPEAAPSAPSAAALHPLQVDSQNPYR